MDNVELLMSFGLTRQEARVYVLLLGEGALSGYEAAKRLGISRSNAYAALPEKLLRRSSKKFIDFVPLC